MRWRLSRQMVDKLHRLPAAGAGFCQQPCTRSRMAGGKEGEHHRQPDYASALLMRDPANLQTMRSTLRRKDDPRRSIRVVSQHCRCSHRDRLGRKFKVKSPAWQDSRYGTGRERLFQPPAQPGQGRPEMDVIIELLKQPRHLRIKRVMGYCRRITMNLVMLRRRQKPGP
jgi:hypothetical protein